MLNCTKMSILASDIYDFYNEQGIRNTKLSIEDPTYSILGTLYTNMNDCYPDDYKLFVLDDAERVDDMLQILKFIFTMMREDQKLLWKIVITTQDQPNPARYPEISKNCFIRINGFNRADTRELFQSSELEEKTIDEIYDVLHHNPLGLTIFMEGLKLRQVSHNM